MLGQGGFDTVYNARWHDTEVAVKVGGVLEPRFQNKQNRCWARAASTPCTTHAVVTPRNVEGRKRLRGYCWKSRGLRSYYYYPASDTRSKPSSTCLKDPTFARTCCSALSSQQQLLPNVN